MPSPNQSLRNAAAKHVETVPICTSSSPPFSIGVRIARVISDDLNAVITAVIKRHRHVERTLYAAKDTKRVPENPSSTPLTAWSSTNTGPRDQSVSWIRSDTALGTTGI